MENTMQDFGREVVMKIASFVPHDVLAGHVIIVLLAVNDHLFGSGLR